MNLLVIEDEAFAAERICSIIRENIPDANILAILDSVEDSITYLSNHSMPQLILTDIELADGQSFDIFSEVKITCPIIFTTAYDQYVLKAFSVHSIDYLLKPIQKEDLLRSIHKFRELQHVYQNQPFFSSGEWLAQLKKAISTGEKAFTPKEYFLVKQGHRLISVGADEVAYFYSEDKLTFIKTKDGKTHIIDQSLEDIEEQVDPSRFFRASRKYLLERKSINNVIIHFNGKLKVVTVPAPKSDDVIVSRDRAGDFRKWLGG